MTAEIIQGSPEWHQARLGHVTASKIADVMAKGKGSAPSVTRRNYMAQLVAERLTGEPSEGFTSADMQHGIDTEEQARLSYEIMQNETAVTCGFMPHPTIALSGASPDGLVGDNGLVEIKCPKTATAIDTLQGKAIDRRYMLQMQWQMACTERGWCDFVSFDPRLPVEMQLHVQRVDADFDLISEIETAVQAFLSELDTMEADLRTRYMNKEAA